MTYTTYQFNDAARLLEPTRTADRLPCGWRILRCSEPSGDTSILEVRFCKTKGVYTKGAKKGRPRWVGKDDVVVVVTAEDVERLIVQPASNWETFQKKVAGETTEAKTLRATSLVTYVADVEAERQRVEQELGVTMTEEKHGDGPVHYSVQLGEVLLEVYPASFKDGAGTAKLGVVGEKDATASFALPNPGRL